MHNNPLEPKISPVDLEQLLDSINRNSRQSFQRQCFVADGENFLLAAAQAFQEGQLKDSLGRHPSDGPPSYYDSQKSHFGNSGAQPYTLMLEIPEHQDEEGSTKLHLKNIAISPEYLEMMTLELKLEGSVTAVEDDIFNFLQEQFEAGVLLISQVGYQSWPANDVASHPELRWSLPANELSDHDALEKLSAKTHDPQGSLQRFTSNRVTKVLHQLDAKFDDDIQTYSTLKSFRLSTVRPRKLFRTSSAPSGRWSKIDESSTSRVERLESALTSERRKSSLLKTELQKASVSKENLIDGLLKKQLRLAAERNAYDRLQKEFREKSIDMISQIEDLNLHLDVRRKDISRLEDELRSSKSREQELSCQLADVGMDLGDAHLQLERHRKRLMDQENTADETSQKHTNEVTLLNSEVQMLRNKLAAYEKRLMEQANNLANDKIAWTFTSWFKNCLGQRK